MDSIWLKIAAFLVVIAIVIIGVIMVMPSQEEEPAEPQKTFGDMVQKDKKIITAEPNAGDLTQKTDEEKIPAESATPAEPVTFYFTKLEMPERVEAEKLLSVIPAGRSIGRLPMYGTGGNFSLMVKSCKEIMERFSGSIYDYKARRALSRIPQHYWTRYKITKELIDLTPFTIQKQNTYPYKTREDN